MDAKGLTDHDLSKLVGTTFQNVNRHKLGRSIPSLDHAFAYARALGTTVEDLFFPGGAASWDDVEAPPCVLASRVVTSGAGACSKCGRSLLDAAAHPRVTVDLPHPNDWRRKLAEDESRLLAEVADGRLDVASAIQKLGMSHKRAFSILGAWTDWKWYEPAKTMLTGSMTKHGLEAAMMHKRFAGGLSARGRGG